MVLFQGSLDILWEIAVWVIAVFVGVAVWYITIVGRDRRPRRQRRGEKVVVTYANNVEENHALIPKFLIYTFVGVAVWAVFYLFWTGISGVTGY